MDRKPDAFEFFGLGYLVGGVTSGTPEENIEAIKQYKTDKNIGEHAARAQTKNATNRRRESVKRYGSR
jgi:hypothetical protein